MDGLNGMNRLLDRKGGLSACCAASRYDVVHDLWVIAAYYNPHGYKTRAKNHALFAAKLEQSGIPLLTVECAFGDEPFALPDGPQVLKLRCASVLWQKERLLNVAVSALPPRCTKVAWLDADILFARPDWAVLTSKLLDTYAVVQVFDHVVRLPKNATAFPTENPLSMHETRDTPESIESFACVFSHHPKVHLGGHYHEHGHSGFGWAARKDVLLRVGLFDTSLSGSGDHLIAHAAVGDSESKCIDKVLGKDTEHREQFRRYTERFCAHTQGKIAATPGTILHLWHGEHKHRRYSDRNIELQQLAFDPARDLRLSPSGAWEWNREHPKLHTWAKTYFAHRKEDGEDS